MGNPALGGKFVFCIIIVVIFIGRERAYRLGGNFEVIKWGGGKPQRDGTIHMAKIDLSILHVRILIWQL